MSAHDQYAGLERKLEQRSAELTEALDYQNAIAEILDVIRSSPSDVLPILEAVAERSRLLCKAHGSRVWLRDGDALRAATGYRLDDGSESGRGEVVPLLATSVVGRAFVERRTVHIDDVVPLIEVEFPDSRAVQARHGFRTVLAVPMLHEGSAVGAIVVLRTQVQPFSTAEIRLIETFADQALIAIENVRLFNETRDALEQQTAISEILRVISASPTDTRPVFDAIAQSCRRLFDGRTVVLARAHDGWIEPEAAAWEDRPGEAPGRMPARWPLDRGSAMGACILDARVLNIADTEAVFAELPRMRGLAFAMGYGSGLFIPMIRGGRAEFGLAILRVARGAFTAAEIALAQTFADQAVIAIENVRLFNETRDALHKVEQRTAELTEALDYQTAISEVLRVISQSPTDVAPVFEAILDSASRLFGSPVSAVMRYDGELVHLVATRNWPAAAVVDARRLYPAPPNPQMLSGRVILSGQVQSEEDALSDPQYDRQTAGVGSWRRMVGAPLLKDGNPVGAIVVAWPEPGPTPSRQADLLKTFADQAVIAIENVRLLSETREALEQQTATAEILQVISRSPTDVQPVFDAICERAMTLCEARIGGVTRFDGELVHLVAFHGASNEASEGMRAAFPMPVGRGAITARAILERAPVQIADVLTDPDYALKDATRLAGYRSNLAVPMLRDGQVVGSIAVCREEPGIFPDKLVRLLQTFADQAVIAIENVRLFNETREALERQTATAEVLQVISGSVADTAPVFDKILDSCERLFAATTLGIYLIDDAGMLHKGGFRGDSLGAVGAVGGAFPRPLAGTATAIAVRERRVVHYPDVLAAADAPAPLRRIAETVGTFSIAFAPMLWEERGVGAIQVSRDPPDPFNDKELALLKTFADQAVIAIQNSRLFNEIQAKSRELE
ncbi:MAG: GAF domain-containing protein, partial [Caldimonas sp.]